VGNLVAGNPFKTDVQIVTLRTLLGSGRVESPGLDAEPDPSQ
jgi:hypothetical protein